MLLSLGQGATKRLPSSSRSEPSDAWNVGDVNPANGKPRKFMGWRLDSGLDDTKALREHIEPLLLFLGVKADALRELWLEYDLTLQCVGYYPASGHGVHLDREVVRRAAQLGLAFDFDFYYVDDPEKES